jgi:hypothetical protein
MDYIQTILTALAPMLTELLATGLSLLLGMVLLAVRKYFGLKGEAILRDALGQAIETGAAQAPLSTVGDAAMAAVEYAKRSSPGAIKRLGASDDVLLDKARAAVKRVHGLIDG